jgi:3-keto-5-aminohexanoate cleavage enzyme
LTRAEQPNLPMTPDEIAADASECEGAGACIYHLHVRDESGRPTMGVDFFRAALDVIRERTNLIVQFTTGGAIGDSDDERMAPLDLRPEMASLTTGTVNFGDEVFYNPVPLVGRLYARMRELSILPEFEIFEPGMIATAARIADSLGDGHHRHFDFVLGVPGAMPAWPGALEFLRSVLPEGSTWGAAGIGRSHVPVVEEATRLGGHVRTGFEDVRWFAAGELARSNSQLVERVVAIARKAGRSIADPAQAREILRLESPPR